MKLMPNKNVQGENITLAATNPRHFGFAVKKEGKGTIVDNFASLLSHKINDTNESINYSDHMKQELAVNPRNVQIHDVIIAAQEAEMSLNFLVSLRDRALRAYQEIISMR